MTGFALLMMSKISKKMGQGVGTECAQTSAADGMLVVWATGWGAGSAVTKQMAENKTAQRKGLVCIIAGLSLVRDSRG